MNTNKEPPRDEALSNLLKQWEGAEPRASFESEVWRRIRTTAPEEQSGTSLPWWREWFLPRPLWANTLAAAAGILVGIGLAFSLPAMHGQRRGSDDPLLHPHTLAGSYLTLIAGGAR